MKTLLGLTLAASLLGGCAVVQIDENLEGLRGKYVVIYFTQTTEEAQDFCQREMNLPLSATNADGYWNTSRIGVKP